jgi:5'-methylthioadenosine phosphorylase
MRIEMHPDIAVIGGTGLETIKGARLVDRLDVATPFGAPSSPLSLWEIATPDSAAGHPGARRLVAFLARHGTAHTLLPSEIPSRANIWALKSLGVRQVIAFSAVGSLREEYRPGDFVACDQLIDRTHGRPGTFFGDGVAGHIAFAEPYCARMREAVSRVLASHDDRSHGRGTLVVMEGPAFSTRAESRLHRSWGADLIGMTALPEARLAREAEMCYVTIAMVTDYDSWNEEEEGVTQAEVGRVMQANAARARALVPALADAVAAAGDCPCFAAAEGAILTDPAAIPPETRERLELLYGRYWGDGGRARA